MENYSSEKMREFCQMAVSTGLLDLNKALVQAAQQGKKVVVQALIEGGADVHASISTNSGGGKYKDEALCAAAGRGHADTVKVLIAAGADVHANEDLAIRKAANSSRPEDSNLYPKDEIQKVRDNRSAETIKVLLNGGANVHAGQYGERDAPLLAAAENGYTQTVKVLLDAGADQCRAAWRQASKHEGRNEDTINLLKEYMFPKNGTMQLSL